jgi:hypothetical protein
LDDVVFTTAVTNARGSTPPRLSEAQSEFVKVNVLPDGDGCV